jgi:hypothetical protein
VMVRPDAYIESVLSVDAVAWQAGQ